MEIIPEFLNQFAGNFTRPAFKYFVRLMKGFLEVPGPKAITELNREKPPEEHFSSIYDFLNRYAWLSQELADTLLNWLLTKVQPGERTILVIDEIYPLWVHQEVQAPCPAY